MAEDAAGKPRIKTVDMFKGFAIITIVMIHVITLHPREQAVSVDSSLLFEFFYTGLMGFFVVSGYFYKPRDWQYVAKRVIKMLVLIVLCIVVGTTLLWGYLNLIGQPIEANLFLETLSKQLAFGIDLFQTPNPRGVVSTSACWIAVGYYFLWSFVITTILFYLLADWSLKDDKNMLIVVAILVAITALYFGFINKTLPFYLQLVPIETAFMLIGAWMGRKKIIHKMEEDWKDKRILIAVVISFIVAIVLIYFFPTKLGFNASSFGDVPGWSVVSFFFINLCGSFVLIYVASLLSKIKYFSGLLCYVGLFSLQILLLSTFFAKIFAALCAPLPSHEMMPAEISTWLCVIIGLVAIACCIVTTYLARYILKPIKEKSGKQVTQQSQ